MAKKVAINGFGRIGRLTFRRLLLNNDVEVVAINDLTDNATLAHLLKYDSAQGAFDGTVEHDDDSLTVNGQRIAAMAERNPADLPWKDLGVDVVLECTGIFRTKEQAAMHIEAGCKDVVISAPAKGGGVQTIVLGVNDQDLDLNNHVFSNASCTTNCMAPVCKLLVDNFGVEFGSMTTTHAYTSDQNIQDGPHRDLRRARAAAYNIVPTSTGAATAVGKVVPEVAGKFSAMALRVPTVTGSLIEINAQLGRETTTEELNGIFKAAADGPMSGVLKYETDPIVSSDIVRSPYSSIFDSQLTEANGRFVKVVSWYDNEAGYSARLADLTALIAGKR